MGREYTIGETARILEVSCDTLRLYEEKGLISPRKSESGYRYYSLEHIWDLYSVIYWRKLGYSLSDIKALIHDVSYDSFLTMNQEKIRELQGQISSLQFLLSQLQRDGQDFQIAQQILGSFCIREFPVLYRISDKYVYHEDVMSDWTGLMKQKKEFGLCYIHEEYQIQGESVADPHIYLTLKENEAQLLYTPQELEAMPKLCYPKCLQTVVLSPSKSPSMADLDQALAYAHRQHLELQGTVHAFFMFRCQSSGKSVHYIQILLPLK